jgi:hypothetical protein
VKQYNDFVYEEIRLECVRVYSQTTIDAEMLQFIKTQEGMRMLEYEDAVARRHILTCFGKKETWRFKAPSTWWQHLKLALRARWPRLFRRLSVRYSETTFDSGWVVPELSAKVASKYLVIPYVTKPAHNIFED